jgi:hypothetical protein
MASSGLASLVLFVSVLEAASYARIKLAYLASSPDKTRIMSGFAFDEVVNHHSRGKFAYYKISSQV